MKEFLQNASFEIDKQMKKNHVCLSSLQTHLLSKPLIM